MFSFTHTKALECVITLKVMILPTKYVVISDLEMCID